MLKATEDKILSNTRMASVNSIFMPMIIGCVILSSIHFVITDSLYNIIFGWVWFWFAVAAAIKRQGKLKEIVKEHGC